MSNYETEPLVLHGDKLWAISVFSLRELPQSTRIFTCKRTNLRQDTTLVTTISLLQNPEDVHTSMLITRPIMTPSTGHWPVQPQNILQDIDKSEASGAVSCGATYSASTPWRTHPILKLDINSINIKSISCPELDSEKRLYMQQFVRPTDLESYLRSSYNTTCFQTAIVGLQLGLQKLMRNPLSFSFLKFICRYPLLSKLAALSQC